MILLDLTMILEGSLRAVNILNSALLSGFKWSFLLPKSEL